MKQFAIAVDQVANTLTYAKGEGFGKADETLSARAWRLREHTPNWSRFRRFVDWLFWVLARQTDHCHDSHQSELRRKHLPPGYLNSVTTD